MSTAANYSVRHYRLATPITGAAHEAWTLVGTEDASFEVALDTDYALIIKVGNSGDMTDSGDFQLQYNVDGAGWNDVNATSSNIRITASGDTNDATSFTERLTSTGGDVFGGSILDESDGLQSQNILGSQEWEFYFSINIRSADLTAGGESIQFRLLQGGATMVHDLTPTITAPAISNTATLPATSLSVVGNAPSSVTTEKNISLLPVDGELNILVLGVPTVVTSDHNRSVLPSVTLTLTPNAPTASVAAANTAQLPGIEFVLTANTPTFEATEHHLSQPPDAALSLVANAPSTVVTENNYSVLPTTNLTLTANNPQAVTAQSNYSTLPSVSLTLTGNASSSVTTEKHISVLPSTALTLTNNAPQSVTTEKHNAALSAAISLALTANAPSAVTTEDAPAAGSTGGYFPVKIPWTEQPPAGTQIDWSNPLNKYNYVVFPFNELGPDSGFIGHRRQGNVFSSPLSGDTGLADGLLEFGTGEKGREVHMFDTYDFSANKTFNLTKSVGIGTAWGVSSSGTAAYGWTQIVKRPSSGSLMYLAGKLSIQVNASNQLVIREVGWGGGINYTFTDITIPFDEYVTYTVIVEDIDGAGANGYLSFWLNGELLLDRDQTGSWENANNSNPLYIGYEDLSGSGNESHTAFFAFHTGSTGRLDPVTYDRSAIVALHENPWQIFQPRTIYFPLAAAAATPLMVPIQVPWTEKPPPGTQIDFSNPFVEDMIFFCKLDEPGDQTNLITGQRGAKVESGVSTVNRVPSKYGLVQDWEWEQGTDETGFLWPDTPEWDLVDGEVTVVSRWYDEGEYDSGWSRIVSRWDGSSSDELALMMSDSTHFYYRIGTVDIGLTLTSRNTTTRSWMESALTANEGTLPWSINTHEARVYDLAYGNRWSSGGADPFTFDSNANGLAIGHRETQDRSWDGMIDYVAIWNRAKPEEWTDRFRANPWQIFQPRTVWVPITTAAAQQTQVFFKDVPWTEQPPAGTPIDWSNPLANGVVNFCSIDQGDAFDHVLQKRFPVEVSGSDYEFGYDGRLNCQVLRRVSDANSSHYAVINNDESEDFVQEKQYGALTQTYIVSVDAGQSTNWNPIVDFVRDDGAGGSMGLGLDPTMEARYAIHSNSWNSSIEFSTNVDDEVVDDGQMHIYSCAWDKDLASGVASCYVDGKFQGSSANAHTNVSDLKQSSFYNQAILFTDECDGTSNYQLKGAFAAFILHQRKLSTAEQRALAENPWQIFQPRRVPYIIGTADTPPAGEDNTSQLAVATLTLTNNAPAAVATEKHIATLPSTALTLVNNAPNSIATESNYSTLPSTVLTLTPNSPSAVATEANTASLAAAVSLVLTGNAPQPVTTEKNIATLPSAALTLVNNAPQTITTQGEQALLPSTALTLVGNAPTTVSTDKNISTLVSASLALTGNAPQSVVTEKNIAVLPSTVLTLTPNAPQSIVTEGEQSLLPSVALSLTGNAPNAVVTEHNYASLPETVLTLTVGTPSAISTESNISILPSTVLTLATYPHQVFVTEGADADVAQLASAAVVITPNAPQSATTEKNIVELPSTVLTVAGNAPQTITAEENRAILPSVALTITPQSPQAIVTAGEVAFLPSVSLSLVNNAPQANVTEHNRSTLQDAVLALGTYPPTTAVTEANYATLPSVNLVLTANSPQAISTAGETAYLPSQSLTLTTNAPGTETTEKNIAALPSTDLSVTTFGPTVEVFDPNTVQLVSASLAIASQAPQTVISERHIALLGTATLSIAVNGHTVATSESHIAALTSASIVITVNYPTVFVPGNELGGYDFPDVIDLTDPHEFILIR